MASVLPAAADAAAGSGATVVRPDARAIWCARPTTASRRHRRPDADDIDEDGSAQTTPLSGGPVQGSVISDHRRRNDSLCPLMNTPLRRPTTIAAAGTETMLRQCSVAAVVVTAEAAAAAAAANATADTGCQR